MFICEMITCNEIEGFHHWPEAPSPVRFLASPHRHIFVIRCGWSVEHNDREKEIFIFQNLITEYLFSEFQIYQGQYAIDFGSYSCESIAENILNQFASLGMCWAEVLEDGKGGAKLQTSAKNGTGVSF